uniref:Reverse transcriptase domain-containing protein n=1 Tax=Heligmosomoides polygyrus TaxID=6339 RepID=A0A183GIV8_HELPZ
LNEEFPRREAQEEYTNGRTHHTWTQEKVRKAIGKMKLGKAAGPDGVSVDAWKVLGDLGIDWLTQFLNRITKEGKMPDDWRNNTIVSIFRQKGDASECSNYRGIKLISHTMKIYERLVDSRLREMVPISQVQWGFVPERSTTDAISIARQVMEKYREKRKPCYLAFLDLEKAYDRLARAAIWNALRGRGVPKRLITVIRDMYEGSKAAIRTPHGEGPLRTILYADDIALVADNQEELEEKVQLWQRAHADNGLRLNVKKTKFISSEQCAGSILDCQGGTIEKEGPLRTILYADDIALVADNQEELEEKVQLWQRAHADNGLRLNVKKTKFISSEQCAGSILDCQGGTIGKAKEFRYLGSDLSEEGSMDQAVRGRINAAWLKWRKSTGSSATVDAPGRSKASSIEQL